MRRRVVLVAGVLGVAGAAGCQQGEDGSGDSAPTPTGPERQKPSPDPTPTEPTSAPTPRPTPTLTVEPTPVLPAEFDAAAAYRHVEVLAGRIGPREATSRAYVTAGEYVERRFRQAGVDVRRQPFRVPAGVSWGVEVPAGRTFNLIATQPGFDPASPHLVVGAHLDTVPQAPGAEDNASGVAVMLQLAALLGRTLPASDGFGEGEPNDGEPNDGEQTEGGTSEGELVPAAPLPLPVVFVAFGAEEPRGEGDARHHYGSKAYLAALTARERKAIRQMVSLDRVGVGPPVRIRTAGTSGAAGPIGEPVSDRLAAAARRVGVRVETGDVNRASDHWPFHRGRIPAARIGGNAYAAYHSDDDEPDVVSRTQLGRAGRLLWAWLTG